MEEILGHIPPVTKCLCFSAVATSGLCFFKLVDKEDLFLDYNLVVGHCQLWRALTAFTYMGELNIFTLLGIGLLFQNSKTLEMAVFEGVTSEFLNFILFCCSFLVLLAPWFGVSFLSESLLMCTVYLLSKKQQESYFGFLFMPVVRVPCSALPYVYLLFGVFKKPLLLGMGVAHTYYFLNEVFPKLPTSLGVRLLKPSFLTTWIAANMF